MFCLNSSRLCQLEDPVVARAPALLLLQVEGGLRVEGPWDASSHKFQARAAVGAVEHAHAHVNMGILMLPAKVQYRSLGCSIAS